MKSLVRDVCYIIASWRYEPAEEYGKLPYTNASFLEPIHFAISIISMCYTTFNISQLFYLYVGYKKVAFVSYTSTLPLFCI